MRGINALEVFLDSVYMKDSKVLRYVFSAMVLLDPLIFTVLSSHSLQTQSHHVGVGGAQPSVGLQSVTIRDV